MKDYYKILDLPLSATQEQIRGRYKELALKYHPDKSLDPSTQEHFKLISEAYSVLSDPYQKGRYDEKLESYGTGFNDSVFNDFILFPFSNAKRMFKDIFSDETFLSKGYKSYSFVSQSMRDKDGKVKTEQRVAVNYDGKKDTYERQLENDRVVAETGNAALMGGFTKYKLLKRQ